MPESKLSPLLSAFVAVAVLAGLYASGILFLPKLIVFVVIVAVAAMARKLVALIDDWLVFFSFVYLADSLRGLIFILTCRLGLPVHVLYAFRWERALFGEVPTVTLQNALLRSPDGLHFSWLEKILTLFHGSHFFVFLLIGFALWVRKSRHFAPFKSSFSWLLGLGVLGFLAFPTAPPWLASDLFGLMPRLFHFNVTLYNFSAPGLNTSFNTNPVAAMPSLHAAVPLLCSLVLWRAVRWKSLPFHLYTAAILFTIVYTADHYVVDILGGAALAIVCFLIGFRPARQRPARSPAGRRAGTIALGGALLALSVVIALTCGRQFINHPEAYDYHSAPRYIDFLDHPALYAENYGAQLYFGNHALHEGDAGRALPYFEKALSLARTYPEKKNAEMKVRQCRSRLGLR
jgi:hypothetical protein